MALKSDKGDISSQSAAGPVVAASSYRKADVGEAALPGETFVGRVLRIVITVTACLLLIQLIDAFSLRFFGHGAW